MKNIPKEIYPDNLILCGYRGSISHNTYIPPTEPNSTDDIDLIGAYLAPPRYYVGLGRGRVYRKAVEKFVGQYDAVFYELRKVVNMLLNANPNVLSLLWLKKEHYIKVSPAGRELIKLREVFLSRRAVYNAFTGYAKGQFKRMTHFGRQGYMGEKRKKLVEKYGYDVKNACHLIRLLHMSVEILDTGKVNVFRTDDAEMLKEIKTGEWHLEDVKAEAKVWFEEARDAYEGSALPDKPNEKLVEMTLMHIIFNHLYKYLR